jgi:CMP-N,N'-diacetyllegionaminic acid synthase
VKTLFLLTARGGSKGVPRKNLRTIAGRSLVWYKITGALQSRYCDFVLVSTDDKEIEAEATQAGAQVPFLRPADLATDTASSASVVEHAMRWVESNLNQKFDAVMLLEPTTPFTRPSDYDAAIELMTARNARLVVGMRQMEVASTFVGPMGPDGGISGIVENVIKAAGHRRQDQQPDYTMNGALYLFGWDHFMKHHQIYADPAHSYGYPMPAEYSIEIDSLRDLAWAEFLVERGYVDASHWQQAGVGR